MSLKFYLIIMMSLFLYAEEFEVHCFKNDFMMLDKKIKVEKVKLYLKDASLRLDGDEPIFSKLYYILENGHTYRVDDLLCTYDENISRYSCGIECDGGSLEYDTKNHVMYMEGLRTHDRGLIVSPDWAVATDEIEILDNPEKGWLDTGIIGEPLPDYEKKVWVYEANCSSTEEPNITRLYYTDAEYTEAFPTKKKRDEYFYKFYESLKKANEYGSEIKTIALKKSYKHIASMMRSEGFDLELFENFDMLLFVYNNKRALVHIGSVYKKGMTGCVSHGYYLFELQGNILKVASFGWESGDLAGPIVFETEVWVEVYHEQK